MHVLGYVSTGDGGKTSMTVIENKRWMHVQQPSKHEIMNESKRFAIQVSA